MSGGATSHYLASLCLGFLWALPAAALRVVVQAVTEQTGVYHRRKESENASASIIVTVNAHHIMEDIYSNKVSHLTAGVICHEFVNTGNISFF